MAGLKLCLFVSDDPDDHQILFEAVKEISNDITLTIITETKHLMQILESRKIQPDCIIVDTELDGSGTGLIKKIDQLRGENDTQIIAYSEDAGDESEISSVVTLDKHLPYPALRSSLKKILTRYLS